MKNMTRCKWCNLNNKIYVTYHDKEWCQERYDDQYLFEMLILESFQAGLSWECILNKREAFRKAYEQFNLNKVCNFDEDKVKELLNDDSIVRNKLKVMASINNARIFKQIKIEYGSFFNYLKIFTYGKRYVEINEVSSKLSDDISNDLKKRGMKFVGTKIIYSYLQAIGIIYSHDEGCYLYKNNLHIC